MSDVWNRSPLVRDTESVGHDAAPHPYPEMASYRLCIWRRRHVAGARDPLHRRLPTVWTVELRCRHGRAIADDHYTFSPSAGTLACSRSIAFKVIRCQVSAPAMFPDGRCPRPLGVD